MHFDWRNNYELDLAVNGTHTTVSCRIIVAVANNFITFS